jgi:hypothetical protein
MEEQKKQTFLSSNNQNLLFGIHRLQGNKKSCFIEHENPIQQINNKTTDFHPLIFLMELNKNQ